MRFFLAATGLLLLCWTTPQAAPASILEKNPVSPAATRAALLYPTASGVSFIGVRKHAPAAISDEEQKRRVDPWFSYDKAQHLTFSFLFTLGWQYGLEGKLDWHRDDALPVSLASTLLIGLGKELYDWQLGPRRFFSYRDMMANGAGLLLATGFIFL